MRSTVLMVDPAEPPPAPWPRNLRGRLRDVFGKVCSDRDDPGGHGLLTACCCCGRGSVEVSTYWYSGYALRELRVVQVPRVLYPNFEIKFAVGLVLDVGRFGRPHRLRHINQRLRPWDVSFRLSGADDGVGGLLRLVNHVWVAGGSPT